MDTYKRLLKYTPEKIHCAYISVVCAVLGVASQMGAFWLPKTLRTDRCTQR